MSENFKQARFDLTRRFLDREIDKVTYESERVKMDAQLGVCQIITRSPNAELIDVRLSCLDTPECKTLEAALFAAKTTLPDGSEKSVFIQDFAASLNRKGVLPTDEVEHFWDLAETITFNKPIYETYPSGRPHLKPK